MKTFYRNHEIQVNTEPSGRIVYDVWYRNSENGQHLLAGHSRTDVNEQTVATRMRAKVDDFIQFAPVSFRI